MIRLIRYTQNGRANWGAVLTDGSVARLAVEQETPGWFLSALLQWDRPAAIVASAADTAPREAATFQAMLEAGALLAPIDRQEVWAAGVTYLRSKVARMAESEGAARFYDLVYDAERPELFLKATPNRVSGPGAPIRIREDARWNVPEPEAAVLVASNGRIAGYTIGNDVSSRDIEGENPLYLPQAKVYRQSCGLGPAILLVDEDQPHRTLPIRLEIHRDGAEAFSGDTGTDRMKRTFGDLVSWLCRENEFPHGAFLCTGTGLVPGDEFTLQAGDVVRISIEGIGCLENPVVQGG